MSKAGMTTGSSQESRVGSYYPYYWLGSKQFGGWHLGTWHLRNRASSGMLEGVHAAPGHRGKGGEEHRPHALAPDNGQDDAAGTGLQAQTHKHGMSVNKCRLENCMNAD